MDKLGHVQQDHMRTGLTDAPSRLEIYVCGPQPCLHRRTLTPTLTLTLTAPTPAEPQLPFFFFLKERSFFLVFFLSRSIFKISCPAAPERSNSQPPLRFFGSSNFPLMPRAFACRNQPPFCIRKEEAKLGQAIEQTFPHCRFAEITFDCRA